MWPAICATNWLGPKAKGGLPRGRCADRGSCHRSDRQPLSISLLARTVRHHQRPSWMRAFKQTKARRCILCRTGPASPKARAAVRTIVSAESYRGRLGFSTPSSFSFAFRRATAVPRQASANNCARRGVAAVPARRRIRDFPHAWRSDLQLRLESIQVMTRADSTERAGHPIIRGRTVRSVHRT